MANLEAYNNQNAYKQALTDGRARFVEKKFLKFRPWISVIFEAKRRADIMENLERRLK